MAPGMHVPFLVHFFQFHVVFGENSQNNMFVSPPLGLVHLFLGNPGSTTSPQRHVCVTISYRDECASLSGVTKSDGTLIAVPNVVSVLKRPGYP